MKIVKNIFANQKAAGEGTQTNGSENLRPISPSDLALGVRILTTNLGFQLGESFLVVTDLKMMEPEAAIWFAAAKTLTDRVQMIVLDEMTHSGQEPPADVVAACAQADVTFLHTTFSLTHTQAGKVITQNHHRGASLPTVDYAMMLRTLRSDYAPIKELGEKIVTAVNQGKILRITTAAGTDLTVGIRQGSVYNDSGIYGKDEIGNLPAGEVYFAPLAGTANGTLIIDGSMADDVLDSPIHVEIRNGVAMKFTGGKSAQRLAEKLSQFGEKGSIIAEVGIGTNPEANPRVELTEAEKAYGTIHVAFGNSSAIGGENDVPIHLDGVVIEPKVEIGVASSADEKTSKILLEKGTFYV